MRKTIDEIKSELFNTPDTNSFRMLTRKEQCDLMGKAHYRYSELIPRKKDYRAPLPKHLKSFFSYLVGK